MTHRDQLFQKLLLLLLVAVVPWGCASTTSSGEPVSQSTTEARAVSPAADNEVVLAGSVRGMVVQIQVGESGITLVDSRVMLVPKAEPVQAGPGMIRLRGLSGGREVIATAVADQEINAQEGVGLVRLPERTLTVSLPLVEPIDELEVSTEEGAQPRRLNVGGAVAKFCGDRETDEWCSKAAK